MAKYLGTTSKVPIFAHGMGSLVIELLSISEPLRGFILSADLAELLASVGLSLKLRGNDVPGAERVGCMGG